MKMKRCKCCGWYFEPQTPRQAYCDEECSQEGRKVSWNRYGKKRYSKKKAEKAAEKAKPKPSAILKVDVSRLPVPPLPPTKEVRIGEVVSDSEIDSMISHFNVEHDTAKNGEFSEDENNTILRMAGEGKTYTMIAMELNRPNPSAIKKQHMKLLRTEMGKAQ